MSDEVGIGAVLDTSEVREDRDRDSGRVQVEAQAPDPLPEGGAAAVPAKASPSGDPVVPRAHQRALVVQVEAADGIDAGPLGGVEEKLARGTVERCAREEAPPKMGVRAREEIQTLARFHRGALVVLALAKVQREVFRAARPLGVEREKRLPVE